jgi:putative tryptophan/tyrosine transport system substrate-binding protein
MKRLAVLLTLALLPAPLVADAQQVAKVPRVGYVLSLSSSGGQPLLEAFRQGLRELEYLEGQTITLEVRWAEGRTERLPELAAELVRLPVDVIVVEGTLASLAAKKATQTIPIVMAPVGDPVGSGVVPSLGRPGGNISGVSLFSTPALAGKRLQLLKEALPKVSRVGVLWNPAQPLSAPHLRETEVVARALGVELQVLEVRGPNEFASAFSALVNERTEALNVLADALFLAHRRRIAELAIKGRLPTMSGDTGFAEAGGLMNYGPSIPESVRRAAAYVDKILKGAKPGDLPVEQPTKFELVINLKTAKALGLTIPQAVLIRADKVIE